jgi:hypothetical protein
VGTREKTGVEKENGTERNQSQTERRKPTGGIDQPSDVVAYQ